MRLIQRARGLDTIDEKEDEEMTRSIINPNYASTLIADIRASGRLQAQHTAQGK